MLKNFLKLILILSLAACSSSQSTGSDDDNETGASPTETSLGTKVNLTYLFEIQIDADDDSLDAAVPFPDTYTMPMYVQSDGTVSVLASDFPTMILRVCINSTDDDCDLTVENEIDAAKIDLVLDACGSSVDDADCGDSDSTIFTGTLDSSGVMSLNALSTRLRAFIVSDSSDGFTADDSDTGLFTDGLPRIITRIWTSSVTSGELSATGSRVNGGGVKLVGGGLIPDDMPTAGGANYIAEITGSFDLDPTTLLEQ